MSQELISHQASPGDLGLQVMQTYALQAQELSRLMMEASQSVQQK